MIVINVLFLELGADYIGVFSENSSLTLLNKLDLYSLVFHTHSVFNSTFMLNPCTY